MPVCNLCATRDCGDKCKCVCHVPRETVHLLHTLEDQVGDVHITIRMRYFGVTKREVSLAYQELLGSVFHPVGAKQGMDNIELYVTDKRKEFIDGTG